MKNINNILLFFSLMLLGASINAQSEKPRCLNSKFTQKIDKTISFSVPLVDVKWLKDHIEDVVILDAREQEEYRVSHIPDAIYVGYDNFKLKNLPEIDKNSKIVVYCSIGYRSEKIAEKLLKNNFTDVNNLYGSIFEWVNQENEVCDLEGNATIKVHTYNKDWSQWIFNKDIEKVW